MSHSLTTRANKYGLERQNSHPDGLNGRIRPTAPPTNVEGRPTQLFFSTLRWLSVVLGKEPYHFRHVLSAPGAQRDDRLGQAATERGQRQNVSSLQILQFPLFRTGVVDPLTGISRYLVVLGWMPLTDSTT